MIDAQVQGGAFVDGEHRYHLWRSWSGGAPSVCWIMLNPSTADAQRNDPTIRKCMGYATRWGFRSIDVLNLYTLRTPDPMELKARGYPVGAYADHMFRSVLRAYARRVIYAWGTKARWDRVAEVDALVRDAGHNPQALRLSVDGHPMHPLYQRYERDPIPFHRGMIPT